MALNKWECEGRDANGKRCDSTAIGTGGALGLRAIGWWFSIGGPIYCPVHRPDPITCRNPDGVADRVGVSCSLCAGDAEARTIQTVIEHDYTGLQALAAAVVMK